MWKYSIKIKSVKSDSWFCLLNVTFIFFVRLHLVCELKFLSPFYPSRRNFPKTLLLLIQLAHKLVPGREAPSDTFFFFILFFFARLPTEPQLEGVGDGGTKCGSLLPLQDDGTPAVTPALGATSGSVAADFDPTSQGRIHVPPDEISDNHADCLT